MPDFDTSDMAELPFPARRARPIEVEPAIDPFGSNEFSEQLEETSPQDEVLRHAERSRRGAKVPRFPTVETMYSAYPDIKRIGKIRIVRLEPKWWIEPMTGQRIRINGILGTHEKPLSTRDIEDLYGGYKYEVFGMMEKYDREDPGGPPSMIDAAVAEFEIPRDPITSERPVQEEEAMHPMLWGRRGQSRPSGGGGLGDVSTVLDFAERMARSNGKGAVESTPSTAFETLARQGEMTTTQLRDAYERQMAELVRRNERLETAIQDMQTRMSEKPDNIGSILQGVASLNQSHRTSASAEELQVLRDQHDREMTRLREDHRGSIDQLMRERDREVERARVDADARVDRIEDKLKDMRESAERRERELRDEFERRERQSRDEHKRQFDTQAQNFESRLSDLRQNHDREVRLLKSMQENTFQATTTAHGAELRSSQAELSRVMAELNSKQHLVDAAIAEKNRPLLDQVSEIRILAEQLGISADKEPPPPPMPENAPLYEKLLMAAMSKADQILPQLASLTGRAVPGAAAAAAVPAAQQPYAQLQAPPQMQGLPPRPATRMSFADSSGPPMQERSAPYVSQSPGERNGMPATSYSPMAPMPYSPPGAAAQGPMGPPAYTQPQQMQQMQQPQMQQPQPVGPQLQQAPQFQPQPQPGAGEFVRPSEPELLEEKPWSKFEWVPLPITEVQGLAATLMQACMQRVEPTALVQALVDEHGAELVSLVPGVVDLSKFIEAVRSDPATRNTVLATGRGKRFLEDTWDAIKAVGKTETKAEAKTEKVEESSPPSSDESDSQSPSQ